MKLTFVRLLVEDYAACFRFYRDVMQFPATFGNEESGYADFDVGSATPLALFERGEQLAQIASDATGAAGDGAALIFEVEDVDRALADLRGRGAPVAGEPADRSDWGIRVAYVRDPDGTLIELNQPIPMSE